MDPDAVRQELARLLPPELPCRAAVLAGAARHLELLVAANARVNLTRILDPREAVRKHVLDSLLAVPWVAAAETVLDLGTGGGFPGIPLALACPGTRFVLLDSVQKKAREVAGFVAALGLGNVEVVAARGEDLLRERSFDLVVVRAVAPVRRLLRVLRPVRGSFQALLLYKGPEVEAELAEAASDAAKLGLAGEVVQRTTLPDGAGERCLVRLA